MISRIKEYTIINLKEPQPHDSRHVANGNFVTNSNVTLTDIFNKKINESHFKPSTNKQNVFAFVMADVKLWTVEN